MTKTTAIPTIPLVRLYGMEFDVALREATSRLLKAEDDQYSTNRFVVAHAKTTIRITTQLISDIATAIRREIARIDSEWWIYDDLEDVRSYRNWLKHLLDRGLYGDRKEDK